MAKQKQKGEKPKNIYTQRKQKKRKRILKQSVWLLLFVMAVLVLYQRRDSWLPTLETIGLRHQNHPQAGATGSNFPIYVPNGSDYQIGTAGKKLLVLNDSYLNIYETDGTPLAARQHTYGNALLQTEGDYAMVYESGGTRFRLETVEKIILEKTVSDPIIFGRVSKNGLTAVVTASDTCTCRLLVFNQKGKQIYERSCVDALADLRFHPDDGGCYAVSMMAANGSLHSVVHSYSFSLSATLWSSSPLDTMTVSVYNTKDGNVLLLGDTMCCFLNQSGEVTSSYVYPDPLVEGCYIGNTVALLLDNTEKRTKTVVILKGDAEIPLVHTYDLDIRAILPVVDSSTVLMLLWNKVDTVTYDGVNVGSIPLGDSCNGFLRIGANLYLHGYGAIDRLDTH